MQPEFKVGDVVTLKSGGPKMTVSGMPVPGEDINTLHCQWFDASSKLVSQSFPKALLNLEEPHEDAPPVE